MVGFLGSALDVEIGTDAPGYVPGDTVQVTVTLSPKRGLVIERGSIRLYSVYRYSYTRASTTAEILSGVDNKTGTGSTANVKEEDLIAWVDIEPGLALRRAVALLQNASFTIPDNAIPSHGGPSGSVDWLIRVQGDIRGARDIEEDCTIQVWPTEASYSEWSLFTPVMSDPDECVITLDVDPEMVRSGGQLRGTVRVTPRRDLNARGVRLQLETASSSRAPHERVLVKRCKQGAPILRETISGPMVLAANTPTEFPFTLRLPKDASPSVHAPMHVYWKQLRAVIDIPRGGDYSVTREIIICSAPAAAEPSSH